MQMPYAVVAVSVMSAVTPELSRRWTSGTAAGFAQRFGTGLRGTMGIILPASVGLVVLAQPLVNLLLYRGQRHGRLLAGTVLAVLAAGLPGFTCFQFAIRGLQAMQRARDAFWLYVAENGLNIALAVTIGRHSIGVLTATVSIAYTLAAVGAPVGGPAPRRLARRSRLLPAPRPRRRRDGGDRDRHAPRVGGDRLDDRGGPRRTARVVPGCGRRHVRRGQRVAHASRATCRDSWQSLGTWHPSAS